MKKKKRIFLLMFVLLAAVLIAWSFRRVPLTPEEITELGGVLGIPLSVGDSGIAGVRVAVDYYARGPEFMRVRLDCHADAARALVKSSWLDAARVKYDGPRSAGGPPIAWWDFGKVIPGDQLFGNYELHVRVLIREDGERATAYFDWAGLPSQFPVEFSKRLTAHNDLSWWDRDSWVMRYERSWP